MRQSPVARAGDAGVVPGRGLGRFLKTSPQQWMHLQADWDLQQAMLREGRKAS
jgi:hypothetical protein